MCFEFQELVLFSSDLKKFFQATFFLKKGEFELEFADFLWHTFPNLDDQFVQTLFKNVNFFSSNQKINCCVNFVIKLIVLSENSRCVTCSREADRMSALKRSKKLQDETDRQLKHALQTGSLTGARSFGGSFDSHGDDPEDQQDRSIMTRCSSAQCLPCVTFVNYLNYLSLKPPPVAQEMLLIEDLRFQDLRFCGVLIADLKHNLICKEFYELLLERLHWTFSPVDVKMKSGDKIIGRRLLSTRLPITLPDAIRLNKRSSENQAAAKDRSHVRHVKFYYDPAHFLSSNVFGRNLIDKLQITVNLRTNKFTFENSAKEFSLKTRKNANFEKFSCPNFVD